MPDRPRILVLANHGKDVVVDTLQTFVPWLDERAHVVGVHETREVAESHGENLAEADLAFVLGGDGTFLSQARVIVDKQIPLLGINFGKVGFLAEFEIEDVKQYWEDIACGSCRRTQRVMIDVDVMPLDTPRWDASQHEPQFSGIAMNDAVITAGPPFRMVEIDLAIDPQRTGRSAVAFAGDGIIVATASGSTAYNLSAGGPIISPDVDALVVSAIAPQSLAFRPIVFGAENDVWITMHRANEGTTLVLDGQESVRIRVDQQLRIKRHPVTLELIQTPRHTYWHMLSHKMHWAVRPSRR
jgi:NAD+ kinase